MPRGKTALMIVDMQEDIVKMREATQKSVPLLRRVLDEFRKKGLPVFHIIRLYRKDWSDVELVRIREFTEKGPRVIENTPGARIVAPLAPREGEYVIPKKRWSGFFMTELPLLTLRLGIKSVVVGGTQTPNCVRSTVYDALAYDLDVTVLSDGTTASTPEIHEANLRDMKNVGVKIKTCEEVIQELRRLKS
ncbi:MAG: isochorismatase family cysteine hydrolase [Thermoplasmata archaeon]